MPKSAVSPELIWRAEFVDELAGGNFIKLNLVDAEQHSIAGISVPSDTMLELLAPFLHMQAESRTDGTLTVEVDWVAAPSKRPKADNISELISRALEVQMLIDEPDVKAQLAELRVRLLKSLSLVDETIMHRT